MSIKKYCEIKQHGTYEGDECPKCADKRSSFDHWFFNETIGKSLIRYALAALLLWYCNSAIEQSERLCQDKIDRHLALSKYQMDLIQEASDERAGLTGALIQQLQGLVGDLQDRVKELEKEHEDKQR